jgi:hypothetical protein
MDKIAEKVKFEILNMTEKRLDYFDELRKNEKEIGKLIIRNQNLQSEKE